MNRLRLITIMGVLSMFGALNAFANERGGGACQEDAKRLCGHVTPGGGAVRDCMRTHEAQLSKACKDNIAASKKQFEKKTKEVQTACQTELKQYCANVTPGEGREFACLKAYEDKLSASCKDKLPNRAKKMGKRPLKR